MSDSNEFDRGLTMCEIELATGYSPKFLEARSDEELIQLHKDRVLQRG